MLDKVYCEACWLFGDRLFGIRDWQHLAQKIKCHQSSQQHIQAFMDHQRWRISASLDELLRAQMNEESNYWKKVLHRLIDIILTLAENNLSFRGHREMVGELQGGNFLALVGLLSRYDPGIEELLKKPHGSVKYLSPKIQNELISLLSEFVKRKLIEEIQTTPFYAIIGDSTQDIAKCDQFSTVIRYVIMDNENGKVEIKESFIGFHHLIDQSATGIENLLHSVLGGI